MNVGYVGHDTALSSNGTSSGAEVTSDHEHTANSRTISTRKAPRNGAITEYQPADIF
jgi:hypothetical protein